MKVLVTGVTGFVGRHVVPQLLERGHTVTAIARDERKAQNFAWFDRVHFIACDIHRPIANPIELFGQPEAAIHLAWTGLPNYKALFHFEENLPADYRFLKTLVENGVMHLLVTGTCFEYGMQSGKLVEDMLTMPENPYALAKDTLRKFLVELKKVYSFRLQWARLFYLYGPGQSQTSLMAQLERALDTKEEVFNMTGGEQLRDYLPVDEAARRLVELLENPGCEGLINICSGSPISVRELVENHIKINKAQIRLNFGYYPYPDYEPMAFWGSTEKFLRCCRKLK